MKTVTCKKLFSLLLCVCMLFSMNAPAFAEGGCTGDADCTLTEGHLEGCPKASQPQTQTVCPGDDTCTIDIEGAEHTGSCPKASQPQTQTVCPGDDTCTIDTEGAEHTGSCPKASQPQTQTVCPGDDTCTIDIEGAEHTGSCPKAVPAPKCDCIIKCAESEKNTECEVCGAAGADLSACTGKERVCNCEDKCNADSIKAECEVCRLADADFGPDCKGKKKPSATVTPGSPLVVSPNYIYDGSVHSGYGQWPVQIVVNFKANDTLEECLQNGYSQWLCDFYLTLSDLSGETITADGCYLAGNYGSYRWVVILTDGMTLSRGTSYPIVSNYDPTLNYKDICGSVKNFTAAIFVHPDILVANPDMVVSLQLRMTNPEDSSDTLTIGDTLSYSASTLAGGIDVCASYNGKAYASIDEAVKAAAESGDSPAKVNINQDYEMDSADASNVELNLLLGAELRVSGESELFKVSGGEGSVVLAEEDATLTLSQQPADGTVVSGVENMMVKCTPKDGKFVYSLVRAQAKIGDTLYETFQDAINAAVAGDTVTLLEDVTLSSKYTLAKGSITIDGAGHSIKASASMKHLLGLNSSGITLSNITLDCNGKANGINIYCAQNVVFDGVSICNVNSGSALTVNGSSLTITSSFSLSNVSGTAIDVSNGKGVTGTPSLTIVPGTVIDLANRPTQFAYYASIDVEGAVDAQGAPYFAAHYGNNYCTLTQMKSRTLGYSNGLTLLTDIDLTDDVGKDLSIKGTLDLNGHDLSSSGEKMVKASGNLTVKGEGQLSAEILLSDTSHFVFGSKDLDVITNLEGYLVLYDAENSVHGLVEEGRVVASIGDDYYVSLEDAIAAVKDDETIKLLQDIELSSTLTIGANSAFDKKTFSINGNGKTIKAIAGAWTEDFWFVDVTHNVSISNLTFDGGNMGCRGVQFYTSGSSLNGVSFKNFNANKWNKTDYVVHVNASNVAFNGVSFSGCKYGHIVLDIGKNLSVTETTATVGSVSGGSFVLSTPTAKVTATEGTVDVYPGIAGYAVVYRNGSYVLIVPVAQIGDTPYESLEAALAAADDGDTVKLLKDNAEDVTVSDNITLDLNDCKLSGELSVEQGKTLSVSEEDLAAAGSINLSGSNGDVKIGDKVIGLSDGTISSSGGDLTVTPSGNGKSYVAYNDVLVGVPAGSDLIIEADGDAVIPAGGSVVFAYNFEVPVAAESTLDEKGVLTLYPAEIEDYGYGKVTVTYGEGAKAETVFVPAGKTLTIKADSEGNPVYGSDSAEKPIVTKGNVAKPKLSISPSKKAFYKYGLGTVTFTCNGFSSTLLKDGVSVDGVKLNDSAYSVTAGSTVVKLKNEYLKSLALGDHTLKLSYADGQTVTAILSIVNTPVTGDSHDLGVWMIVLGLSGLMCTTAVLTLKRRRS